MIISPHRPGKDLSMEKARIRPFSTGIRCGAIVVVLLLGLVHKTGCESSSPPPASPMTDKELAVLVKEVFIYSLPVYEMYRTRYSMVYDEANPNRADLNELRHRRGLLGPDDRLVTAPNNDTLFSNVWLDLSEEPVVLQVPDTGGRYYVLPLMDFYTNVFDSVGSRKTGTGAGTFVIAGPDWDGMLPGGTTEDDLIFAPTNSVWIIGRTLVEGEADLPAVHDIQDQYLFTPRIVRDGQAEQGLVETDLVNPPPAVDPEDPWNFFHIVNLGMTENPPPAHEQHLMDRFASIRVGPGQTFDPHHFTQAQQDVIKQALVEARTQDIFMAAGRITNRQGWSYLPLNMGYYGEDYAFRALIALAGLGALPPEEAFYYSGTLDTDSAPLDARENYILRFEAGELPPVDAFWSLTLYELDQNGRQWLTPNSIGRYSIGDRTEGLQYNLDGSLTIYLQPESPGVDLESNWLPTPAEGASHDNAFRLSFRTYMPGQAIIDGTYRLPGVERAP